MGLAQAVARMENPMTKLWLGMLALAFAALVGAGASAQNYPITKSQFCGQWEMVCNRTCPGGPGTCTDICKSRRSACDSTGCFHFNVPRPRCYDNREDVGMTFMPGTSTRVDSLPQWKR